MLGNISTVPGCLSVFEDSERPSGASPSIPVIPAGSLFVPSLRFFHIRRDSSLGRLISDFMKIIIHCLVSTMRDDFWKIVPGSFPRKIQIFLASSIISTASRLLQRILFRVLGHSNSFAATLRDSASFRDSFWRPQQRQQTFFFGHNDREMITIESETRSN